MEVTRRDWLAAAALTGIVPGVVLAQEAADTAAKATAPAGGLTEDSLGKLLQAIGLKPTKSQSRYDFQFNLKPKDGEEWTLSMSAVLSGDLQTVWVMAWLDELPRSSRDVPRVALLKLLAENDRMGKGKFFSYIPANRRFALQQVIDNSGMSTRKFHTLLVDLGHTVMETYPQWSTEAWVEPLPGSESDGTTVDAENGNSATQAKAPASQTGAPPAARASGNATPKPRTAAAPAGNVKR